MNRSITHFKVGNGNCSVITDDNFTMAIDLNSTDEINSFDLLKPFLRLKQGILILDVLVITHGDEDHCKGFEQFAEQIEKGNLIIRTIVHQGVDRLCNELKKDLPTDYLALREEIERRALSSSNDFGDIEVVPDFADNDSSLEIGAVNWPEDFKFTFLNSGRCYENHDDYSLNDMSLVLKVSYNGISTLYAADSTFKSWSEQILPRLYSLERSDFLDSDILVASHHGSATFFDIDRETARDAIPYPANYVALELIKPETLVLSASSKFPLSGDTSGDNPPHYAAWKWYHKWFIENMGGSLDKEPECFKFTSIDNVQWAYSGITNTWVFKYVGAKLSNNLKDALPVLSPKIWGE
ncbi:MAG: hypothetical protein JXR19_08470 [Bacteroidia bacterium]